MVNGRYKRKISDIWTNNLLVPRTENIGAPQLCLDQFLEERLKEDA